MKRADYRKNRQNHLYIFFRKFIFISLILLYLYFYYTYTYYTEYFCFLNFSCRNRIFSYSIIIKI